LYCYLVATDSRHREAVALLTAAAVRLTHSYVLAELVALCNSRKIDRRLALDFVTRIVDEPGIDFIWIGEQEHRSAVELLRNREDKDYSLCDALSFLLMRQSGETDALTSDHHFEQEGFVRLLRP